MDRSRFGVATWGGSPFFVPLPEGPEGVLLSIGGTAGPAQLYLVCGGVNETVTWVQAGDFSLAFARRQGSPLTMLTCEVGTHRWLLAPECPVLRVGPRKFSFGFPGYFYALALPAGSFDEAVRRLELNLMLYCAYANHAGQRDYDFCDRIPGTNFWASAYYKIKLFSVKPTPQPLLRDPAEPPAYTQWTVEQTTLKFQRALRASAATKMLAKILHCPIDFTQHIEVVWPAAGGGPYIFPSLRAVLDIVDAVEAAMGIGAGDWSMAPDRWAAPPRGALYWYFNVSGLMWILRSVAAVAEKNKANQATTVHGGGASATGPSSSSPPSGQAGNSNGSS